MAAKRGQTWYTHFSESSLHILVSCLWRTGSRKKHLYYGLLVTGHNSQQNMETHQWGSDSSFIQSSRGDDHLSSAALVLSSPCSLDCVLLSDWHEECVLFHLRPLKPVQDMCLRFISVCNWCCLHVCRSRRVCGGAASVSAEVHQHVRFLSVQLCWRISASSRSDLLHRCVCVCVELRYYLSVCECL